MHAHLTRGHEIAHTKSYFEKPTELWEVYLVRYAINV